MVVSGRGRCLTVVMSDAIFVGLFIVMMALAFGYVRVCERIVRADSAGRTDS